MYPQDGSSAIPLVFHIGFSDNYKELSYPVDLDLSDPAVNPDVALTFAIELSEIFKNPTPIDLHTLPNVMFDPEDVATIANNYVDMISLDRD